MVQRIRGKNAKEIIAETIAREQAAMEEARRKQQEEEEAARQIFPEMPELPLGGYAGWACQYAEETGQEAEGCGGGGGGGFTAVTASVHKYNACEGRFNPNDRHEVCCVDGEVVGHGEPGHPTRGATPCDIPRQKSIPLYQRCPPDTSGKAPTLAKFANTQVRSCKQGLGCQIKPAPGVSHHTSIVSRGNGD
jgi:hypothetical protein